MEVRRICPRCRKRYSQEDIVCTECGERLADVSLDFEASVSMVREPVLLACNWDVETMYLEDALRQRNIPYYVEECMKPVPTGNIKEDTIDIVPFTNYYVDRRNMMGAADALKQAKEETRWDEEQSAVFFDMPEDELEDEPDGQESEGADMTARGWFMGLDLYIRVGAAVIGGALLLSFIIFLF